MVMWQNEGDNPDVSVMVSIFQLVPPRCIESEGAVAPDPTSLWRCRGGGGSGAGARRAVLAQVFRKFLATYELPSILLTLRPYLGGHRTPSGNHIMAPLKSFCGFLGS